MVQRVLCFPGYGQNAATLDVKLAAIKQHCAGAVEFVSIDPFYVLHPRGAADGVASTEDATDIPYNAAEEERRAWGLPTDEEHTFFDGLEDSFVYIRVFLASQKVPFDGVLGFSQGAAIASMTACLLEDSTRYPAFLVDGQLPHPPMKFAVCISGAMNKPLNNPFTAFYSGAPKLKTPVLHVVGRTDVVVSWKRTKMLIDAYESPRVEWHKGGHYIPSTPRCCAFFNTFISAFDSSSSSKASTATATDFSDVLRSPSPQKDIPWTYWVAATQRIVANN